MTNNWRTIRYLTVGALLFCASQAHAQRLPGSEGRSESGSRSASDRSAPSHDGRLEAAQQRDRMVSAATAGALAGAATGLRTGTALGALGGAVLGGAMGAFGASMQEAAKVQPNSAGSGRQPGDHPERDSRRDRDRQNDAGERHERDVKAGRKIA